jgi:hypothetical protein
MLEIQHKSTLLLTSSGSHLLFTLFFSTDENKGVNYTKKTPSLIFADCTSLITLLNKLMGI